MTSLDNRWKAELRSSSIGLGLILLQSYWKSVLYSTLSFSLFVGCSLVQPFLVATILNYVQTGSANFIGVHSGIGIALIMGIVSLLGAFGFNLGWYFISHFSLRVKTSLLGLIYDKSLTISTSARQKFTTGEIMTLLSVDVERIWNALGLACWYWIVPIMCSVGIGLLYVEIGVSAFYCAVTLIVWSVFQHKVGDMVGNIRLELVKLTAQRVNLTKEVLQGVRLVKLYAWEAPTEHSISEIRAKEIHLLSKYHLLKMLSTAFQFLAPVLLSFVAFSTFALHGGHITQTKTFTVLAILNLFRLPIFAISIMFSDTAEALKGLERIKNFLAQNDMKTIGNITPDDRASSTTCNDSDILVRLERASFSWGVDVVAEKRGMSESSSDVQLSAGGLDTMGSGIQLSPTVSPIHDADFMVLQEVSCTVKKGDMVAIVGTVGAGKSSLLSALLGQVTLVAGTQKLCGHVAYVSQEHWIQNMTVRDNILFGSPMNNDKYHAVIAAAQLQSDLQALPAGDMTEIGERGINLSGGQKARCSIARCLYADGVDLYIFDDPLAAVDAHVGQGIFSEALVKLLKDKARIVTMSSNYHLLPFFSRIWVVEEGRVTVCEDYQDLVNRFPHYESTSLKSQDANNGVNLAVEDSNVVLDNMFVDSTEDIIDSTLNHIADKDKLSQSIHQGQEMTTSAQALPSSSLLEEEDMERGVVSLHTYVRYFGAAYENHGLGGIFLMVFIAILFTIGQSLRVLSDMWVGLWSRGINSQDSTHGNSFYMAWYCVIVAGTVVFVFCRGRVFIDSCMLSSARLHKRMLSFLLKAPVNLYFDVVPLGRILNRISADMDKVDSHLPDFFLQSMQNFLHCVSIILLCISSMPVFTVLMLPISVVFVYIQHYFRKTSREVKRLESVSRSPLYVLCSEVIGGMATIRAYGRQKMFQEKHRNLLDENCRHNFMYWMVGRWLSLRLETLSNVVVLFVGVLAVLIVDLGGSIDGELLGLALVYSVQLTGLLQWTVRTVILTEDGMTSVERLVALESIKQERPSRCHNDPNPMEWPSVGKISLKNLTLRYRPELPLVLKNVNVDIPGGCKVGIVGRTGSGKSSLVLALFRLVEPESPSVIEIDGINTLTIGLEALRSQLTAIPQDPIMFSGSIRFNLDPFDENTDADIWNALEKVQLKEDILEKFPNKLNHMISENGDNLSVGQKQLMCIVRALLRKSKIIILDEATASIDTATDKMIQRTVRTAFHECTVLTIAHRIDTILDYDRILVMDGGVAVEFDAPQSLLAKENGIFKSLVEQSNSRHN